MVPRVIPKIAPRAWGSQCGAPNPTKAGTTITPPESGTEARFEPLKGLVAWPVRLAFYKLKNGGELPYYEIGFNLFENGVPSHVSLEYADFSIAGKMTQIEILPDPGC